MKNLLTLEYWFSVNPGPVTPLGFNVLITISLTLFLAIIVFLILKKRKSLYRGIYRKLYDFSIANFVLSLLFLFFHFENIPFFTARFWLAIWIITLIIWLIYILKKIKKIPERRREMEKEMEKRKYLP